MTNVPSTFIPTPKVRGYSDLRDGLETLYAVYENGKILRTWPHEPTPDFCGPGKSWMDADEVPNDARFIGMYAPPR